MRGDPQRVRPRVWSLHEDEHHLRMVYSPKAGESVAQRIPWDDIFYGELSMLTALRLYRVLLINRHSAMMRSAGKA